jgi:hypothetical protein
VGHHVRIAGEQALGLLGRCIGYADGRAFRQPHLEEQFGTGRGRKELLLNETESCQCRDEHQHRGSDDGLAPAQAKRDDASQRDRCACRRWRRMPVRTCRAALPAEAGSGWPADVANPKRLKRGGLCRGGSCPGALGQQLQAEIRVNRTATSQDAMSASPTIQKMPPAYSPAPIPQSRRAESPRLSPECR